MEGHNAFFVANAAAEVIDLDKKTQIVTCSNCKKLYAAKTWKWKIKEKNTEVSRITVQI